MIKLQAVIIEEIEDKSLRPIVKAHLVAGCPAAAAQVSALVRPVPAVGRPVAPPRRGQAGALVRAPELPRRARVVAVGLVRGRGARRGVRAVVLPVADPALRANSIAR